MVVFGLSEVVTGFTHHFFGVSIARATIATYAGATIGALYALSGLLVLSMKRQAAALAILLLVVVIIGRITMVVTGLYPIGSFKQISAIVLGTCIVAVFALYITLKRSFFN
jgi:hypothetical protein